MRAAILHDYGAVPVVEEVGEPAAGEGQAVARVLAAGLNPIDLRLASGRIARKSPVGAPIGGEGIADLDGRRVYFDQGTGAFAERAAVALDSAVEVPDGLEDGHALCYGIAGLAAWLALERRAQVRPDQRVLVLGASGTVGLIAVQAAKLLGAGRVVAAARSAEGLRRAGDLGADAVVQLGAADDLPEAFRSAAGGEFDVVIDPLWGAPAAAAVEALGFRGRLVQLGQSAGAQATLPSTSVRFKELEILGHTNYAAPAEVRHDALRRMFAHAAAGELRADYELVPLTEIAEAWRRQAESPGTKLVLVP